MPQGFGESSAGSNELVIASVRPSPAGNIGLVSTVLIRVIPARDLLIVESFHSAAPNLLKLRHALDRVHGQTETINLVLNRQFQRRIDIALFLVAANVQILVICAAVRQAMDEPGVSVKIKNDRLIYREQRIKIPV